MCKCIWMRAKLFLMGNDVMRKIHSWCAAVFSNLIWFSHAHKLIPVKLLCAIRTQTHKMHIAQTATASSINGKKKKDIVNRWRILFVPHHKYCIYSRKRRSKKKALVKWRSLSSNMNEKKKRKTNKKTHENMRK